MVRPRTAVRNRLNAARHAAGVRWAVVAGWLRWLVGDRRSGVARSVVIVSGLPRSGTSMIMGMLAAGGMEALTDGVRAPDDDNPRGYFELERVRQLQTGMDTAWLRDARGKCVKVISYFLKHLPAGEHYRIVFVRRNLAEVLASQRRMLDRRGEPVGDEAEEERLAGAFAAHLIGVERELEARADCEVLHIDHRAAIESPRSVAEQVNAFLGERLDVDRMAAAVDPRLYRQRASDESDGPSPARSRP